ncbi:PREDICTED: uncharacterized protein LOC101301865 [Fragaria vesca subsp. vesca]|uniref:uncharacterized protein LOC101301865 n=1 Tax=Fragaria vesca subsp. vesca TaxID=101020 RepID=UPI0002C2F9E9|nr:PREDICTED: uncharacterized protein LOC101301865 [Fragaria vesca subsp. vesca]
MASLATHFSAFVLLSPVGLRRLLCSSSLYLKNPSLFRAKTWYFSDPKWKNIDLYALLIALPIASFSEIFIFLAFSGHPTYRFAFFQQSATIFFFWLLLLLIILRENLDYPMHIDQAFIFVLAAVTFFVEYSVIGKGISGLGGTMYDMLGVLTLACAFSCLYLSFRPRSFFAEFFLSSGLVFKGTWMLQLGLSLYTDTFGLKGCKKMAVWPKESENAEFKCDLEEDGLRGVAVMTLLFIGHAIGIMMSSFVMFGWLGRSLNCWCGEASGPLLQELESEQ